MTDKRSNPFLDDYHSTLKNTDSELIQGIRAGQIRTIEGLEQEVRRVHPMLDTFLSRNTLYNYVDLIERMSGRTLPRKARMPFSFEAISRKPGGKRDPGANRACRDSVGSLSSPG